MGIYQRKQESKKTRKHAFDQDSNQERNKKGRKRALDQESGQEKKQTFSLFFLLVFFYLFTDFFMLQVRIRQAAAAVLNRKARTTELSAVVLVQRFMYLCVEKTRTTMAILAWQNVLGQMQHALANALAQPLDQDIQKYKKLSVHKICEYWFKI